MRITSLTLHGFKSFAEHSTIEFVPGITAIVGPNGSGKSNLIDALRWSSGGGRASEFRAGNKTELIFHGAAGKRGVSYAEVELELEHNARSIRISRSLWRDGQSKLKLNGKNARFLDLEDKLSGSGLGRGNLAIIGQGEVSQVLMADPEKLLSYVAEAAGVAKLSSRREQSQARFDTAREHLQRLEDIIIELERQLELLKEEAEQAELAIALKQESLQLRYSLSSRRVSGLKAELDDLYRQKIALQESVTQGKDALVKSQKAWHSAREKLSGLEQNYRQTLTDAEARRGDLRVAEERYSSARQRFDALTREVINIAAELDRLNANRPPSAPEGDEASLRQQEVIASAELLERQEAVLDAEAQLNKLNSKLQLAREEEVRHTQALAGFQAKKTQLERQLADVDTRLATLTENDDDELLRLEQTAVRNQALQAKAQEDLEKSRNKLVELQQAQTGALAEAQALDRAAERSRLAHEARRGYAQGPKNALTSGISGVIGSVADLLSVPEAYQLALSSALGRRAEHVLVDNAETGQKVLIYLKRAGGWATLLPLDLIEAKPPRLEQLHAQEPGVIGLCVDFIDVEPRYAKIAYQLLRNTILVETMAVATSLARKYTQRPRLVTLEGDLLEPYGAMTGGHRQHHVGLLGARAELAEAKANAKQAEALAQTLTADLQALQRSFKKSQEQLNNLVQTARSSETALSRARESVAVQRSLKQELEQRRSKLAKQLKELTLSQGSAEFKKENLLSELEQSSYQKQTGLATLRQQESAASRELAEARQNLAVFRERLETHQQALARYEAEQQRLTELSGQYDHLQKELARAKEQLKLAQTQEQAAKKALPQDLADKEAVYLQAQLKSEEAEQHLEDLSRQQAEQGAALEQVQISLARREAAFELAKEELTAFPAGLEPLTASLRNMRARLREVEQLLTQLGPVNHRASLDYETQHARLEQLQTQSAEAGLAVSELETVLSDIDTETTTRLNAATDKLRESFLRHVEELFGAGSRADIIVERSEGRPVGLNIDLQPPGKQTKSLNLLSVGERTMGAMAFLFALMTGAETGGLPIAILDEVDAPLDEANIRRFSQFLDRKAQRGTQFILITHQKATMEVAAVLWGVTTEQGVSRVFSISKDQSLALASEVG